VKKIRTTYYLPVLFSVFLFSCVNTKKLDIFYIYKKQIIYEGKTDSNGRNIILKDSITVPLIVKITKSDSFIRLRKFEGEFQSDTLRKNVTGPIYKGLFFPYFDSAGNGSSTFVGSKKLKYLSTSPVFQALTIPLKLRFEQGSTPYEAEASINFGVAFGWKFTHHEYENFYHRRTGLFVSSENNHYSITPGVFVGPAVVELTPGNSNATEDRNVFSLTYGAMLVFGINRLNIGLALGFDNAVAGENQNWIYQGKPWVGFTISFDLIQ
jgi:hypothetical protein